MNPITADGQAIYRLMKMLDDAGIPGNGQAIYRLMKMLDDAGIPGNDVADQLQTLLRDYKRLEEQARAAAKETDYERLLKKLDEDRDEVLLLLHDAALDAGMDGEAQGWGWLAMNHKWPNRNKEGWFWYVIFDPLGSHADEADFVPPGIVDEQESPSKAICSPYYPTCRAALQAVVDVIVSGQWKPERKK